MTPADLTRLVLDGLPATSLYHLADALEVRDRMVIGLLHLSGITDLVFQRRLTAGRLSTTESEHLVRLARVTVQAQHGMGVEAGNRWLMKRWPALGFKMPLTCAETESGVERVVELIDALTEGMFA